MSSRKKYTLLLLPVAALALGLSCGSEFISPLRLLACLSAGDSGIACEVLHKIRLPRVAIAMFAGAALSVSGAAFQSVFRNPLADPFITGISGGAALGVSVAVIAGLGPGALTAFSFAGSSAGILLIYFISRARGLTGSGLILSGVALSFIFSSSVMLIFSMAKSGDVHKIIIWLMGDLSYQASVSPVIICFLILCIMALIFLFHRQLDLISMGRRFSRSSGVSDTELRVVMVLASVLASLSVLLGGVIPFIGLMIPHMARSAAGPEHNRLLPVSALAGGSLLVAADALCRSMILPFELPVGVVTGFCGGIFFLVYILKNRPEL